MMKNLLENETQGILFYIDNKIAMCFIADTRILTETTVFACSRNEQEKYQSLPRSCPSYRQLYTRPMLLCSWSPFWFLQNTRGS